ncbi:MAG: inositol oxygenase family protein [Terracidiphilus sp.]
MSATLHPSQPLAALDQWDDFVEGRYREGRSKEEFRVYDAQATPGVAEFYRLNHENQTVAYVLEKEKQYFALDKGKKTIWEAVEFLNTLVDDSDPDTDLTQIEHLLQTSEAMRRDHQPRWMILTGFLHDLGKCLCLYGEPQWGVVGDTFPVGCAWSPDIVFPEYFYPSQASSPAATPARSGNPDRNVPEYQTKYGIYEPNCGLENVHMSFGHDGYIAEVMKPWLRTESLYMLRFHSFYPWHRHGAYDHLANAQDRAMLEWVLKFNQYDLYSKGHTKPDVKALKPYYDDLFAEFLPERVAW